MGKTRMRVRASRTGEAVDAWARLDLTAAVMAGRANYTIGSLLKPILIHRNSVRLECVDLNELRVVHVLDVIGMTRGLFPLVREIVNLVRSEVSALFEDFGSLGREPGGFHRGFFGLGICVLAGIEI